MNCLISILFFIFFSLFYPVIEEDPVFSGLRRDSRISMNFCLPRLLLRIIRRKESTIQISMQTILIEILLIFGQSIFRMFQNLEFWNFPPKNFMETESSNRNILCISYFPDLLHLFAVKIFVEIFMWKAQCKIQQNVFHQTRCNKALSIYCVRVEK